jgi:hypothetical protein
MLQTVIEKGHIINTTERMPDECFLKKVYQDEGVKQSIVYLLHCEPSELTYVSVASYKGEFTGQEIRRMDLLMARLRSVAT